MTNKKKESPELLNKIKKNFSRFLHFIKNLKSSGLGEKTKEKWKECWHWLSLHNMTVWPVLLIACLIITIVIGVNTKADPNKTTSSSPVAEQSAVASTNSAGSAIAVTDEALKLTDDENMNDLMASYYKALAAGDTATIATLVDPATDTFLAKVKAEGDYIDSYPAINVYTKPGPIEGSYLAYVYTEVQMTGYNKYAPGLTTFYVCTKSDGSYYINMSEELPDAVAKYIHDVDLQDDVIDLNNKVTAEFNDLVANDATFAAYYTKVTGEITSAVGTAQQQAAAATDQAAASTDQAAASTQAADASTQAAGTEEAAAATASQAAANTTVKATDVVNMRSSDSETADKVGKAQIGDTFTLLETKNNGWSKVSYNGQDVYIKSQYLEAVSSDSTADAAKTDTTADASKTDTSKADTSSKSNASLGASGYVTAKTTVNIRKSCSETGDKLGTVYMGTKLELVMQQADGWCKVKYNGETGYVKSDYVE